MDYWNKLEQLQNGSSVEQAVAAIANDIQGRKGIGNELEAIDDETVVEMLDEWVRLATLFMRHLIKDNPNQ